MPPAARGTATAPTRTAPPPAPTRSTARGRPAPAAPGHQSGTTGRYGTSSAGRPNSGQHQRRRVRRRRRHAGGRAREHAPGRRRSSAATARNATSGCHDGTSAMRWRTPSTITSSSSARDAQPAAPKHEAGEPAMTRGARACHGEDLTSPWPRAAGRAPTATAPPCATGISAGPTARVGVVEIVDAHPRRCRRGLRPAAPSRDVRAPGWRSAARNRRLFPVVDDEPGTSRPLRRQRAAQLARARRAPRSPSARSSRSP